MGTYIFSCGHRETYMNGIKRRVILFPERA